MRANEILASMQNGKKMTPASVTHLSTPYLSTEYCVESRDLSPRSAGYFG